MHVVVLKNQEQDQCLVWNQINLDFRRTSPKKRVENVIEKDLKRCFVSHRILELPSLEDGNLNESICSTDNNLLLGRYNGMVPLTQAAFISLSCCLLLQ